VIEPAPGPLPPMVESALGVVGVGIDLTHVSEVRDSIRIFGDRYLYRVFTERELADCRTSSDPVPRLAARFAAKEAAVKALRVEGPRPPWTSMEVSRDPGGWCDEVRLRGAALRLARARGIGSMLVSLSHEADAAVAVVVATRDVRSASA
jgi:holo-[acyl-carrier protein] synthase